jgi:hypothetical protein
MNTEMPRHGGDIERGSPAFLRRENSADFRLPVARSGAAVQENPHSSERIERSKTRHLLGAIWRRGVVRAGREDG